MEEKPKKNLLLFSGSSNKGLAQNVSESLNTKLGDVELSRFSDGEICVKVNENVRGANVYIIQSTCPPVNDNLMEVLVMVDAFKRASARSITAVIPYYGYARQDRKVYPRTPITAKMVADLLETVGVNRMLSLDLHSGQIQGFFNIPFDNLFARPVLIEYIRKDILPRGTLVLVSPDAGGMERTRAYAKKINARVAMIDKRRPKPNQVKAMHLVGEVKGCTVIIIDDMVDTAGTLTESARSLVEHGAKEVYACAVHGVLSGPAVQRIEESPIKKLILTDTIPLKEEAKKSEKFKTLSVASLIGESIHRIDSYNSVSSLFD